MQLHRITLVAVFVLGACSSSKSPTGATDGGMSTSDAGMDGGVAGPQWTDWDPGLPDTATLPKAGDWRVARGIIHLHSPYSHDACDNEGYVDGVFNEPCEDDLRTALCKTRQDFALLTDHPAHMAEIDFNQLLAPHDGDEQLTDDAGSVIGVRIACDNGARPLVMPGYEDELMPVMMTHHAPGDAETRGNLYNGYDAPTVAAMRDTGALIFIAHTEQRDPAFLSSLGVDATEVYNLHANLAPNIREEFLGLPGGDAIAAVLPFWLHPDQAPLPDLAALAFIDLTRVSVTKWEAMTLAHRTLGTAGSDAHENVFPDKLGDGERGDSYRRVLRWFSNHLRVTEVTPAAIREALLAERWYAAFEVLGTPSGFDFYVKDPAGTQLPLGGEGPAAGQHLIVKAPTFAQGAVPVGTEPELHVRLYRVTGTLDVPVEELVTEGAGDLDVAAPGAGVYHVELTMVPTHLQRWMGPGDPAPYLRELPWIFSAAIYLR